MAKIRLDNKQDFEFIECILNQTDGFKYVADPVERSFDVSHPIMSRLLNNISSRAPTVVPRARPQYDEWVVMAPTRHQLDRLMSKMNRFIIPSYGVFPNNNPFPILGRFESGSQPIHGQEYYSWYSPIELREKIFAILDLWLELETERPDLRIFTPPNFRDVFNEFQSALAGHNWDAAENALSILQKNRLTTLKNINFLTIELLAQKQQYEKIWADRALRVWVTESLPRRIQVALLRAFHHQYLLENDLKGDVESNLAIVQKTQSRFDKLFRYRQDIIDDKAVRVFAYLSIVNQTPEAFEHLASIETLSEETSALFETLHPYLQALPEQTLLDRSKELLRNLEFANAYEVAKQIDTISTRVFIQLQCLWRIPDVDVELARSALEEYRRLDEYEKRQLDQDNPAFMLIIDAVKELAAKRTEIFTNWLDWFENALIQPDTEQLTESLKYLEENTDKEYWNIDNVSVLYDYLGVITFDLKQASPSDQGLVSSSYFQRAMHFVVTQILQEEQFPRSAEIYGNLYDVFYSYLLYSKNRQDETLLRFADDKMAREPSNSIKVIKELLDWIDPPRPARQETWLEIIEMAIYHGVGKEHLYPAYQAWIQKILDTPGEIERAYLEVLLALSFWFGGHATGWVGQLEDELQKSIAKQIDPIALLPSGYHIIIYTLDESSAKRVENILLQRNKQLHISLCHEKSMTPQIERLTNNADMHVLVTTCMKHNVFYGVSKGIKEPIYPQSRGSTSILRAIENYAAEKFN